MQELCVDDIVWLNAEHISLKNIPQDMSKKLQHKFLGPFAITDVIVPKMTFQLELSEY